MVGEVSSQKKAEEEVFVGMMAFRLSAYRSELKKKCSINPPSVNSLVDDLLFDNYRQSSSYLHARNFDSQLFLHKTNFFCH